MEDLSIVQRHFQPLVTSNRNLMFIVSTKDGLYRAHPRQYLIKGRMHYQMPAATMAQLLNSQLQIWQLLGLVRLDAVFLSLFFLYHVQFATLSFIGITMVIQQTISISSTMPCTISAHDAVDAHLLCQRLSSAAKAQSQQLNYGGFQGQSVLFDSLFAASFAQKFPFETIYIHIQYCIRILTYLARHLQAQIME